jgi:hypothetical protein
MKSQLTYRKAAILGLMALIIVGVTFAQLLSHFREALSAAETPTPYPSDYPPIKQTREAEERQTGEAWALTPFPTGTIWDFPIVTWTAIPDEAVDKFPVTPAGDGNIIYRGADTAIGRILGIAVVNRWVEEASDRTFDVLAGADMLDGTQGMVFVVESLPDGTDLSDGGYYLTPIKAGPVRVVDAQGERLILNAEDGTTFYFDVRGQTFVSSLSEVVPTMTFWPTPAPRPTKTPAFTDDLPNDPYDVLANSPVNTNLRFVINPAGDLDWFRFFVPMTTTLQVHLESLPANYDLYVYSATQPRDILGISRKPNKGAEVVILKDAPPDDYYVLVTSVNGSFDAANPYQLRFEVPGLPAGGTPPP